MTVTLWPGDCRDVLSMLPSESVHCCVTSPPYWGLRDYGTASWEGGDAECDHTAVRRAHGDEKQSSSAGTSRDRIVGGDCRLCGARRVDKQVGLEVSPEEYVASIVEIFREVRRVLRDDGTLWLNLGDSYAAGGNGGGGAFMKMRGAEGSKAWAHRADKTGYRGAPPGLKPKDLVGIPWRVAFALQADGWYLRSEIVWSKPNPMPESVIDRPTKAHEQVFLLAKSGKPTIWRARDTGEWSSEPNLSERLPYPSEDDPNATVGRWRGYDYFYDADAIKEEAVYPKGPNAPDKIKSPHGQGFTRANGKNERSGDRTKVGFNARWRDREATSVHGNKPGRDDGGRPCNKSGQTHRNKRSVWTISPKPFKGAHFATMPPDLAEPCIKAGAPVGGTVLDPFGGAGTTAMVAEQLGRNAISIELNPEYIAIATARIDAARRKAAAAAIDFDFNS